MAVKKTKSKAWYTIISPEIFGAKDIGKTTSNDPDRIMGRIVSVSAMEVTNNFNKYYLKFKFRVSGMDGDKARTVFDGFECMRDYISRMVIRYVRRIDTIQDLKTKDGVPIRVKTMAITSKKMKSSVEKIIRARIAELVKGIVEETTLEDFLNGIIDDQPKIRVLDDIRRIYPVRNFEFRKTEVLR